MPTNVAHGIAGVAARLLSAVCGSGMARIGSACMHGRSQDGSGGQPPAPIRAARQERQSCRRHFLLFSSHR